jgi:hypothetical protein
VAAPVNTIEPQLRGNDRLGKTLRTSNGSWANTPEAFGYQWRRCDSDGSDCVAISGAADASYVITSADAGRRVRAVVTASNAGGSRSAASDPSDVIQAARNEEPTGPTATALPEVNGDARVGASLTASSATSAPSSAVVTTMPAAIPAPGNTGLPEIAGEPRAGKTLRASTGIWSGLPLGYTYQWLRCNATGRDCAPVAGATASKFVLDGDDVGKTLRVNVIAGNVGGSTSVTSEATTVVASPPSGPSPAPPAAAAPAPTPPTPPTAPTASAPSAASAPPSEPAATNTVAPVVTGPELVGKIIQATLGVWTGNPKSFSVQWLRCAREEAETCSPILGATQVAYTVTPDDVDRYVVVEVTVTGSWGSATVTSKFGKAIKR